MLIEREGKIVTREEIKRTLWANDTVVDFDQSINATIKALRRALGDSADNPRYIETLGRRGYRLILPIQYSDSALETVLEKGGEKSDQPAAEISENAARTRPQMRQMPRWRKDAVALASVFDGALNTALRYELEQTPYLNLLGLDKTYATIGQMKLAPTTKITPEIARQICSKTNSKMVIADSIADAGNRYHLQIGALDCGTGAPLAEEETDISARNQIVHELGVMAARLRGKLGEPAESLARFNQPLETALSPSLEALQSGSEGVKLFLAGHPEAALPLFQRGIELDPDLALSYEGIGAANQALAHYDLMAASWTRAYQLRDRMTEKGRLNAEYLYYNSVTGELDKAYSVLVRALELFPRDVFIHNNRRSRCVD